LRPVANWRLRQFMCLHRKLGQPLVLNGKSAEDRVGCTGRKREFGVGKRRDAGFNTESVEQRFNRMAEFGFIRSLRQDTLKLLLDLLGPVAG
jgi:hypothetical protein